MNAHTSTPGRADERGVALITVLATTFILAVLATGVVAFGIGSQNLARHDQDWNAALAAAEAGIDDYLFRLNEDSNYWQYNDANLPADPPTGDGNRAFVEWTPVPGGGTAGEFQYNVDTSNLTVDGRVIVRSTGRVRNVERTVETTLRRRSFLDYLYFTDYETFDPTIYTGSPFSAAQAQVECSKYWYAGRNPNCYDINFISSDTVNGPLHSNDAILMCGSPVFNGETSTSYEPSSGPAYRTNPSCGSPATPVFANPGDPQVVDPLTLPPSNSKLKAETNVGEGGCLYTGPTEIVLNSNGSMTVDSPFSKSTNNSPCPTNGTGPLPSNGVIFVQNVPADSSDPNYTYGCPYYVDGRRHPLGLPISYDRNTFGCRDGDVFVEGTLDGQLTIAAENDVLITWHLTYADGLAGDDLLGLVANNFVSVYHPVGRSGYGWYDIGYHSGQKFTNPTIYAAILSVNHSFRVPHHNHGSDLGTLHVRGVIAQRYRGPVGTFSGNHVVTGYSKDYVYDQRMKYLSPPKFLDPVASAWTIATWAEVKTPADLDT